MTFGSEGVLDADNIAAYVIGLQVHDGGSPPLSSTAVVNVYVNSTNRPPVFSQDQYEYRLSESSSTNVLVGTIVATDRDINTGESYN